MTEIRTTLLTTEQSCCIGQLAGALARTQGAMTHASKDSKNPHMKSTYADLASVWDAARQPLATNELAVAQTMEVLDGDHYLATTLMHSSGEWMRGRAPITAEGNRGVNANQALGSSITYLRRYCLAAMLGIYQDDDDAEGTTQRREQTKSNLNTNTPPIRKENGNGHNGSGESIEADVKKLQRHATQKVIESIEKGEELLSRHPSHEKNSRQKHLGTESLIDADPQKLAEYLIHLREKHAKNNTDPKVDQVVEKFDGELLAKN